MSGIDWAKYHPYIKPHEMRCRCGCGLLHVKPLLLDMVLEARLLANIPFIFSSGSRCPAHNRREGGSSNSAHMYGDAIDVTCHSMYTRGVLVDAFRSVGFKRIGLHKVFVHADIDLRRPWGIYLY